MDVEDCAKEVKRIDGFYLYSTFCKAYAPQHRGTWATPQSRDKFIAT